MNCVAGEAIPRSTLASPWREGAPPRSRIRDAAFKRLKPRTVLAPIPTPDTILRLGSYSIRCHLALVESEVDHTPIPDTDQRPGSKRGTPFGLLVVTNALAFIFVGKRLVFSLDPVRGLACFPTLGKVNEQSPKDDTEAESINHRCF